MFSQLYGQTECYPISVLRKGDHDKARPELFASCGFPISSVAVQILDDSDQPVKQGSPAKSVCAPGMPSAATGSGRNRRKNSSARAGCIRATSRAWTSAAMYILDRKKDMIVSGASISIRATWRMRCRRTRRWRWRRWSARPTKWGRDRGSHGGGRPGGPDAEELIRLVKDKEGRGACAKASNSSTACR